MVDKQMTIFEFWYGFKDNNFGKSAKILRKRLTEIFRQNRGLVRWQDEAFAYNRTDN